MTRARKKRSSHPRLEAIGWDQMEPTCVIKLGLESMNRTDQAFRNSVASVRQVTRDIDADLDELDEADSAVDEEEERAAAHG